MAKFVFQLDGVLRQRKLVEEQRQREMAIVQAEMAALENELRALDQTVKGVSDDVRDNRLVGRLDLSYLAAHRRWTIAAQRQAVVLAQKMAGVRQRLDAARAAVADAAKQRKVIEKLREKRQGEWRADLSRREMAELDEVATRIGYENAVQAAEAGRVEPSA